MQLEIRGEVPHIVEAEANETVANIKVSFILNTCVSPDDNMLFFKLIFWLIWYHGNCVFIT